MKKKSRLLRKIIKLQKEEKLIPPDASVLIALSGGIDSVVLTHALLELREFFRFRRLALAHFNHRLRQESKRDEEFCRKLAQKLNLEIFVKEERVGEIALRHKRNIEETARELRYGFLRRIKEEKGFDLIATAHHLNDLVETTLLWLVRGAGTEGLLGFEPREGDVVRPLYLATRREIAEYATAESLSWVEDTSNADRRFFRNRLRHEVIPLLKELNPNLEETLLRTRLILKEEDNLLRELSEKVLKDARVGTCLEVRKLRNAPVALQRRAIREFTGIKSFSKVEQVRRLLDGGGEVIIGDRTKVVRKGKMLCLKKEG